MIHGPDRRNVELEPLVKGYISLSADIRLIVVTASLLTNSTFADNQHACSPPVPKTTYSFITQKKSTRNACPVTFQNSVHSSLSSQGAEGRGIDRFCVYVLIW